MKYMIMTYGSQQDYDALTVEEGEPQSDAADELAAIGAFLSSFSAELAETGELVDAQGLTAPAFARRVTLRDSVSVVTDGPFAETEEVLAGFWIVDCASIDRAVEIAARLNQCPGPQAGAGTVVRPIAD